MRYTKHSIATTAVRCLTAITFCFLLSSISVASPVSAVFVDKARTQAARALRDGDFTLAEQLYRELLGKNSHDNDARLGLSLALLKQRNLQDAYDHASRVISAEP